LKTVRIIVLISIIVISQTLIAEAQGGSNYSLFGIGDIQGNSNAFYDGMGGTSIAMPSEHGINPRNPAMWSKTSTTRLLAGYKFNQHILSDANGFSLNQNDGKVNGVTGLFSIDTSLGISVVFGLVPYSNVSYLIQSPVNVILDETEVQGKTEYQGNGGMTSGFIGASVNIFKNLSVGGAVYGNFGIIQNSIQTTLYGRDYYSASNEKNDHLTGLGFKSGILYSPFDNFSLGAFYENHNKLTVNREQKFSSGAVALDTTSTCPDFSVTMPVTYGFGVSYQLEKFLFGVDVVLQDFTNFDYNPGPKTRFRSTKQYSLGLSRIGNKSAGAEYLDRVTYNLGGGYRELYYIVNNQAINEYYVSVGGGFPLLNFGSSFIDVSLAIGSRGTDSNGLIREIFGRLTFDISIGEIWFKPFKREY